MYFSKSYHVLPEVAFQVSIHYIHELSLNVVSEDVGENENKTSQMLMSEMKKRRFC